MGVIPFNKTNSKYPVSFLLGFIVLYTMLGIGIHLLKVSYNDGNISLLSMILTGIPCITFLCMVIISFMRGYKMSVLTIHAIPFNSLYFLYKSRTGSNNYPGQYQRPSQQPQSPPLSQQPQPTQNQPPLPLPVQSTPKTTTYDPTPNAIST